MNLKFCVPGLAMKMDSYHAIEYNTAGLRGLLKYRRIAVDRDMSMNMIMRDEA